MWLRAPASGFENPKRQTSKRQKNLNRSITNQQSIPLRSVLNFPADLAQFFWRLGFGVYSVAHGENRHLPSHHLVVRFGSADSRCTTQTRWPNDPRARAKIIRPRRRDPSMARLRASGEAGEIRRIFRRRLLGGILEVSPRPNDRRFPSRQRALGAAA